jgi:MerR family transcriptional regulator, heat shock protein HspR
MITERKYEIVLQRSESQALTLNDLALHAGMHPASVERLVEFGLIVPMQREGTKLFEASAASRLRTIGRLREHLGVNLAGISVILDLLEKVCTLQRENRVLRHRL